MWAVVDGGGVWYDAKVLLCGVELARAVVKGEDGERRDWEEEGVRGAGVEAALWRGRGEVPALVELEMESQRLSWSKVVRLEIELSLLEEEEEPSLLADETEGFSPRSHISEREGGERSEKMEGEESRGGREDGGNGEERREGRGGGGEERKEEGGKDQSKDEEEEEKERRRGRKALGMLELFSQLTPPLRLL